MSERFSFVHAADLHLDSPFRALRADERASAILGGATFEAFTGIVDLCLRERAAFLALAGDLFDAKDRSVRARLALRRELQRLDAAGIRTFAVHGNHDPFSGEVRSLALPPSVKVFGPDWEEVQVEREGRILCRVQGVSYGQERVTENLSRRFKRGGPEFTLGLLHANLGGEEGHANYAPCTAEELSSRGLDYWALGHVHTRAEHRLANGALAVYPGNPQGRHVNEAGERGCVVVEVDGRAARTRFVPLDRVRWHRLSLDVSGLADVGALADAVERLADSLPEGPRAHAIRLSLEGRGAVHSELSIPEGRAGIEEELAQALATRPVPVLLEALEDSTRPALDPKALRDAGGLPAEVLRAADEAHLAGAASLFPEELRNLDAKLARMGVAKVEDAAERVLERAADRAVELLVEGA